MPEPVLLSYGSLFIESPPEESEAEARHYIDGVLAEIYGEFPAWLNYKVGARFERQGIYYRKFLCPSGSVDSRIQQHAEKPGGIERIILMRGTRFARPYCGEIRFGIETQFECEELMPATDTNI